MTDEAAAFALGWFGYGSWTAKYWFVGMEPGRDEHDRMLREGPPSVAAP
jgi:hypothetical protein